VSLNLAHPVSHVTPTILAVRSAILATAWLLVLPTNGSFRCIDHFTCRISFSVLRLVKDKASSTSSRSALASDLELL